MKSLPIIMSGPMVVALLEGRKTQTRRISKPKNDRCAGLATGDQLWVRETWRSSGDFLNEKDSLSTSTSHKDLDFKAGKDELEAAAVDWRSPLFLPCWDSRITLTVKNVSIEPLHVITSLDAIVEGIQKIREEYEDWYGIDQDNWVWCGDPVEAYSKLWNKLQHKDPHRWEDNPIVTVIKFTVEINQ